MKLTLEFKTVFGNERYYPACKESLFIASLMAIKSFTPSQVGEIRNHGWEVGLKAKELP